MYHYNPKTGVTGECRAVKGGCPFGEGVHFETELEARAAYENHMVAHTFSSTSKGQGKKPTLEELQQTLTPVDLEYGKRQAKYWLSNQYQYRFRTLMGAKSRMTAKKLAEYDAELEKAIEESEEFQRRVLSYAKQSAARDLFARAYEQGISTPLDPHFEAIWEGREQGCSKETFESRLAENRKRLEQLAAGTISPTKIVGSGYRNPKKVAREWVENQLRETERALATRGRSDGVNIANAEYRLRESGA